MPKSQMFTNLVELKVFLNSLSEDELDAHTNTHDWYEIEIVYSAPTVSYYYEINGYDGGEE